MKRILIAIISIVLILVGIFIYNNIKQEHELKEAKEAEEAKEPISYFRDKSMFHNFTIDSNIVTFMCSIQIKNNTDKDLKFYMNADVKEDKDIGLLTDEIAQACNEENLEKKEYFIEANSEIKVGAYFKAQKGTKIQKTNRLPPPNIYFDIKE